MCTTIITKLPLRFLTRLKLGETPISSTCRYLTCGSDFYRRQPLQHHHHRTAFNFCRFPDQQILLKCVFSTVPKSDEFGKTLISDVGIRKQQPVTGNDGSYDEIDKKKIGIFARFKLMYKQYWYVLIPVHVITSIGWLGGFYYLSQSGVDIPAILESMNVSESIIDKLRASSMGHVAIAYLCYKIATPVRYMVTLGGTTVSIKYLEQYGYIKPLPSKSQLIQMYEDKKADRAKRKQDKVDSKNSGDDDK